MTQIVKEQILKICDTGLTNMFDLHNVLYLAEQYGFTELISYIRSNSDGYIQFILTGK